MFRTYNINPYQVSDRVRFKNIDKSLILTVRADASMLVTNLSKANKRLTALTDDETTQNEAALFFATAIFGKDQAEQLVEFYADDPLTVINVCGMYFKNRLGKLIEKAQKR